MPPVSPTSTRLTKRSSKVRGWRRRASARVDPCSTERATRPVTSRRFFDSLCSARMVRHWTSGRPASIMVENWRVTTAISLSLTLAPDLPGVLPPAFSLIFVTRMARFRSSPTAAVRSCASISPVVVPAAPRPWYVKTAMSQPPVYLNSHPAGQSSPLAERGAASEGGGRGSAREAGRQLRQLLRQHAPVERFFAADLAPLNQLDERLVHRLHAELLARLEGRVDLVDLFVADEVPDGRGGHHDLERHDPTPAVGRRDQLLGQHAFEDQRQLRPNLGLLGIGEDVDDPVDGLGAGVGVERAERKMACLG